MYFIEGIYRNSAQPSGRTMRSDKHYTRAKNQVQQYYQYLCSRLTEYDMSVLNKLLSCHDKQTERKNIHCFEDGFKTGLAVAIEALKQE